MNSIVKKKLMFRYMLSKFIFDSRTCWSEGLPVHVDVMHNETAGMVLPSAFS